MYNFITVIFVMVRKEGSTNDLTAITATPETTTTALIPPLRFRKVNGVGGIAQRKQLYINIPIPIVRREYSFVNGCPRVNLMC